MAATLSRGYLDGRGESDGVPSEVVHGVVLDERKNKERGSATGKQQGRRRWRLTRRRKMSPTIQTGPRGGGMSSPVKADMHVPWTSRM